MREEKDFLETELRRFQPYPKYKDSGVEWLGKIPAHWNALSLKKICRLAYGDALQSEERRMGVVEVFGSNGAVGIHDRANTGGPCLVVGRKGSFGKINYSSNPVFAIDTTFFVDRHLSDADLRWLFYILTWLRLDTISKDSAIPGLGREDVYACLVPSCNQKEQQGIAAFLDRETAKIDALIAKKERLIELLQEKRTALITQAVTKGLDPTVPMKDSGVEWLGEIPALWKISRLKYLSSINDETLGEKTDPRFELVYIDIGGVDEVRGVVEREKLVFETAPSRARRIVKDGDVIISTVRTYLRAIAPIKHPESNLIVSTGFGVIRPSLALKSNFAAYALRASYFIEKVVANSVGVSYPAIDANKMSCFPVATPNIEEQQDIASFLDRETAKIDALVTKIQEAINRLKEYRTALISAAVTGKIDVRGDVTR